MSRCFYVGLIAWSTMCTGQKRNKTKSGAYTAIFSSGKGLHFFDISGYRDTGIQGYRDTGIQGYSSEKSCFSLFLRGGGSLPLTQVEVFYNYNSCFL